MKTGHSAGFGNLGTSHLEGVALQTLGDGLRYRLRPQKPSRMSISLTSLAFKIS
ncbi:MAG: hypothetical protein U1F68_15190 [Gammaproteobacteria bacterium]